MKFEYKKVTASINRKLLECVDLYAAEHYISRAPAIHLLLMEAMKMEDIEVDETITRMTNPVKIVINVPVKVANDLEEYIAKNNIKTRTAGIYILLTAALSKKGYWKNK